MRNPGRGRSRIDIAEMLSAGEQVSAVCTVNGWYVVGVLADARRDRLDDVPLLGGPFPSLAAAHDWWLRKYGAKP